MVEYLNDRDKKVLELDARRKIYNVVREFAGCHFREIERRSGLSTGSVKYHLDYLAKKDLIMHEKEGNNIRYFPRDFSSKNKKLMSLLRQKSVRKILIFILSNNNCNHEQIVEFAKLSPSTVSWHLKKLMEDNIIGSIKKGRKTIYSTLIDREEVIELLITYKESFFDAMIDRVIEMWDIEG